MFCKYCGNELPADGNFCPKCGRIQEAQADMNKPEETAVTYDFEVDTGVDAIIEDPALEVEKDALGGRILTFAVLGLSFGISFWLSFLGIVFSAMAKTRIKEYVKRFGETEGRASVGKGLSTAGLAASIALTCCFTVYMFVVIALALFTFLFA